MKSGKKKKLKIKSKLTNKEVRALSLPHAERELSLVSAGVRIFDAILRLIFAAAVMVCVLFLFSCASVYGYSEPEEKYTVSALGFDSDGSGFSVTARVSDDKDSGDEARLFFGSGESVSAAMAHIKGADSKGLELSHLAAVVVGDGIGSEEMSEIFEFCRNNRDIAVGVCFAASHSAENLISSPEWDGYELTGALRSGKGGSGYALGCRFYEIENARLDRKESYRLPYFSEWEEGYTLDGLKIYTAQGETVRLDRSESAYYMMVRGLFEGGAVDIEYKGREYSIFVSECKTGRRATEEKTQVDCKLELDVRRLPEGDAEGALKSCSARATELCRRLAERYGDILGFHVSGELFVNFSEVAA